MVHYFFIQKLIVNIYKMPTLKQTLMLSKLAFVLAYAYFVYSLKTKGMFVAKNYDATSLPIVGLGIAADVANVTKVYTEQLMTFMEENPKRSAACSAYLFGKDAAKDMNVFKANRMLNTAVFKFLESKTVGTFADIYKDYKVTLRNGNETDLSKIIDFQHDAVVLALKKTNGALGYIGQKLVGYMKSNPDSVKIITDNRQLVNYQKTKDWDNFKTIIEGMGDSKDVALSNVNNKFQNAIKIASSYGIESVGEYTCQPMKETIEEISTNMQTDINVLVRAKWVERANTALTDYNKIDSALSTKTELTAFGIGNVIIIAMVILFLLQLLYKVTTCCFHAGTGGVFTFSSTPKKYRRRKRSTRKRSTRKRSTRKRSTRKRSTRKRSTRKRSTRRNN
jgi:hypothetical protein